MTTLTQPLEISILAAPLAAIDRRALSQAWYSALGYAHGTEGTRPCVAPERSASLCHPERSDTELCEVERSRGTAAGHCAAPSTPRSLRSRFAQDDNAIPRDRRRISQLAQRIETKLLLKMRAPARASIAVAGGRVHLTLQRSKERLHIVALCPKHSEAAVARALAQARYALTRRGILAEALVRGAA